MADNKNQNDTALTVTALIEKLEALQVENARLKAERDNFRPLGKKEPLGDIPNSKITRKDHPEKGGGYIVQTPRPWTGSRMGVTFAGGVGIIDEADPKCDELAHVFQYDHGYSVQPATGEELGAIRRMMTSYTPPAEAKTSFEKLMRPDAPGHVVKA